MKALGIGIRKLVLGLSLAQILPEKLDKMFSQQKHGFIDVNRTVSCLEMQFYTYNGILVNFVSKFLTI